MVLGRVELHSRPSHCSSLSGGDHSRKLVDRWRMLGYLPGGTGRAGEPAAEGV